MGGRIKFDADRVACSLRFAEPTVGLADVSGAAFGVDLAYPDEQIRTWIV